MQFVYQIFQDVSKSSVKVDAANSLDPDLKQSPAQAGPSNSLKLRWEGVMDPNKPDQSMCQQSGETSEVETQEESETEAANIQNQDKSLSPLKIHVTSVVSYFSLSMCKLTKKNYV